MPPTDALLLPPAVSCSFALPPSGPLASRPEELAPRLGRAPGFFWLERGDAVPGERAWSYLGLAPLRVVTFRDGAAEIHMAGVPVACGEARPIRLLARELGARRAARPEASGAAAGPEFRGGWFAALAYDLGREIERLPSTARADLPFPDLYLALHETVLAFDHRVGSWWASVLVPAEVPARHRERRGRAQAEELLASLSAQLAPCAGAPGASVPAGTRMGSTFTRAGYEAAVARALDYIAAGDIYQVNLSQRFQVEWTRPALDLFLALRRASPARYAAFVNLGAGRAACSVSPELFLEMRDREILTRPIKGTRPRGATPEEDGRLAAELEASPKERAELTMIVDLERNDLGRVCDYGSVRVASAGTLERLPTVFHRVATVAGRLHSRQHLSGLLRATFPGGSVTGAPKIRAMEIIEELEPTRRGLYCGALGWIGADGDLSLNLPIRTALVDEGLRKAWYQAGSGIVADSDPAQEFEETLAKARAFFQAVGGSL